MATKSRKEQIEEMLRDEPNDPELLYMLAMEHASAGQDADAVAVFTQLTQLQPGHAQGFHMASRALVRLGRIDDARNCLTQGIAAAQNTGNDHAAAEMQELLFQLQS